MKEVEKTCVKHNVNTLERVYDLLNNNKKIVYLKGKESDVDLALKLLEHSIQYLKEMRDGNLYEEINFSSIDLTIEG